VLCVSDLDPPQRTTYRSLGFTLTPPAVASVRDERTVSVQFAGLNFLELLAVGDPAAIPPHGAAASFQLRPQHNRDFLRRHGEGMSMLRSRRNRCPPADAAAFETAGLTTYEAVSTSAATRLLPDGTVARGRPSRWPSSRMRLCRDIAFFHQPASVQSARAFSGKPPTSVTPNGAQRIVEVVDDRAR